MKKVEHTPTPWNAASAYSSICGVPIVSQTGGRVGNTALPDMPKEWDELKQRAVADAALIVKAVNNHEALVETLKAAREQIETLSEDGFRPATKLLEEIDRVLTSVGGPAK
jgi:hypothetical protein